MYTYMYMYMYMTLNTPYQWPQAPTKGTQKRPCMQT